MDLSLINSDINVVTSHQKGLRLIKEPGLFQNRDLYISKNLIELQDQNFNTFESALGEVKTYKSTNLRKDRLSGEVVTEINSVNITKSSGKNYLSIKKFTTTRNAACKVNNTIDSLKLTISKEKQQYLDFIASALLERNLL